MTLFKQRLLDAAVALSVLVWLGHEVSAQPPTDRSLTEVLTEENSDKLLLEAAERGDIVRGAILFHQGNIACAKCHRPVDEHDRIGPNLSRLADSVTDESIIDSILQPSKVIAGEYQASTVLDVDGNLHRGVMVKQDEQRIVIRDMQDVAKLITIERQEIEQVAENPSSIMPAGLIDQLKGRQQFLDLLKYVLDLKHRGAEADIASSSATKRRKLSPELSGLVTLRKYNCVRCHDRDVAWETDAPANAPDLRWSARHVDSDYLVKFISDPHATKPGTAMPQLMATWNSGKRQNAAEAIVAYLRSLDLTRVQAPVQPAGDLGSLERGNVIFHEVGCVACHSPRDASGVEMPIENAAPLGTLTEKYSLSSLITFLEDPHASRPHGLMPNMRLSHREATDVSAFLLQTHLGKPDQAADDEIPNAELISEGQRLFRSLSCNRCHETIDDQFAEKDAVTLHDANLDRGCMAEQAMGSAPRFELTATERSHLRAALQNRVGELSDQHHIDLNLAYFNCTACHSRNDLGGVPGDRRVHFQTINLNLGEQGRIPPTLSGVGAKLKRKWMRDVLVNGRSVRPYMKTRMPQYGEANIGHLVDLFQSTDDLEPTEFATFDDQKEMRLHGLELAGNKGLNCVACHTYQYKMSDTMPAVDLTEMAERLKKDWFYQYMLAPQQFVPGTVMPSFWPNGKAIRPDLKGTPNQQVEAIWQYLIDGRQARAPRGVIRKPLEIVVQDEARMLRRSYQGMGKRGIGVGYPGGINLAYDAEQLRLATLWKGRFIDPSGVWYGQGHGKVKTLGPAVNLRAGPELDDANNPWIVDEGRPPDHRFLGYSLDSKRRPTFRYSFGNVQVEDYFAEERQDDSDADSLRREITLSTEGRVNVARFRLLSGTNVQIASDGKRVSDGRLTVQILSGHVAEPVDVEKSDSTDQGTQAFIPLDLSTGKNAIKLQYTWE